MPVEASLFDDESTLLFEADESLSFTTFAATVASVDAAVAGSVAGFVLSSTGVVGFVSSSTGTVGSVEGAVGASAETASIRIVL